MLEILVSELRSLVRIIGEHLLDLFGSPLALVWSDIAIVVFSWHEDAGDGIALILRLHDHVARHAWLGKS